MISRTRKIVSIWNQFECWKFSTKYFETNKFVFVCSTRDVLKLKLQHIDAIEWMNDHDEIERKWKQSRWFQTKKMTNQNNRYEITIKNKLLSVKEMKIENW